MSEAFELSFRFGTPRSYKEAFKTGFDTSQMIKDLKHVEPSPRTPYSKMMDKYEANRQTYLRLINQCTFYWETPTEASDLDVQISRIYVPNPCEYFAFMRIHPRGFRAERSASTGVDIIFKLVMGKVIFHVDRRLKDLIPGKPFVVKAGSCYSIRCPNGETTAYLAFEFRRHAMKPKKSTTKMLALPAPPTPTTSNSTNN